MYSAFGTGHVVAGRYRLLDQLGRGAMGIVWRGRDELLDRDVAIKQIVLTPLASATEAQASYQRTLREARSAARLSHPGVVTVFDIVEEDGSPWIVMELVRARPLDQVIAEDGPLPPARAAQLGLGLLDALATAHEAGVLHRDVKPSNVLISPDGKAVLTDFGIATIQGDPGLTQAGMVVGTPGFSPPERVRGAAATPASDLWSLGATLYAAVEGRGPFDRAGGSAAIIASIATEPAPRAPSAGPLAPVIEALLRTSPADRPDAAATAQMLRQAWRAARAPDRTGLSAGLESAVAPAGQPSEATTATQVVRVPPDPGSIGSKASRGAAAVAAGPGSASTGPASTRSASTGPAAGPSAELLAGAGASLAYGLTAPASPASQADTAALRPAAAASSATNVVPDLMATPNFAELKMPETGTPDGPHSAGIADPAHSLSLAGQPAKDGPVPPAQAARGVTGPAPRGTAAGEFLRSKRGIALLAPLAALALAAGVIFLPRFGLPIDRIAGSSGPGSGTVAADHVRKGDPPSGSAQRGSSSTGTRGGSGKSDPPAKRTKGKSPGHGKQKQKNGKPTPSKSAKPSGSPTASGSPSPSASPTPTPSTTSRTPPPAGYVWDTVSAASVGTIAGFQIAGPATWPMNPGLKTVIRPTAGAARLDLNLAAWALTRPVKEARRLSATAIANGTYPGYELLSIVGTTFRGWPAARWTFWWQPVTAVYPSEETALLFTAQTWEGPQQYIMSISAPQSRVTWAEGILHVAMRTFTPLPQP
jgi:hypothetical protein